MGRHALGAAGVQLYTACNLWYEHPQRMWSTGYRKGAILPAGTAIQKLIKSKKWMKYYILFVNPATRIQHGILWAHGHHPGISLEQYVRRTFTDRNFDALVTGFSAEEVTAIHKGQVQPGMSRRAVLVSWGFPPEIGTPTLEAPQWKYWTHRFANSFVNFDGDVVTSVT
jgi:hypothetical protein